MPILFLDFDGVLHPEHCHESKHFCCLPILEEVLRQAPEWKVVVTSTWRLDQPFEAILQRFSPDIARVIEGVTPKYCDLSNVPDTLVGYQREAECHAWLRTNDVSHINWLALDDRSWLFRPFSKSLFLIDGREGLTKIIKPQLTARLRSLL
ncbi:HAD domain-containing protein [Acidovorax sp. Leaf73]|uniref:HAD domain-containing protein n=1 Tax=Acidovorax sp. Leaf73 TaxID=2876566 RepID=UPI001E32EC45|nr:HAD domain-containing protein [Acidovorax sp. Leaf73]